MDSNFITDELLQTHQKFLKTQQIIDPHIHIIEPNENPFSPKLKNFFFTNKYLSKYTFEDYENDTKEVNLVGCVHLEVDQKKHPSRLQDLVASKYKQIKILVVGTSSFIRDPNIKATLESYFPVNFVVGVRDSTSWHENETILSFSGKDTMINENWQSILKFIESNGTNSGHKWSIDLWLYSNQLDQVEILIRTFPNIQFILDHVGTPVLQHLRSEEEKNIVIQKWKEDLVRVAKHKNVFVKLSGLGMPVVSLIQPSEDVNETPSKEKIEELVKKFGPFVHYTIETFGIERCMVASNFPVDRVASSYLELYLTFSIILEKYSSKEKNQLFYQTAFDIYFKSREDTFASKY